jgi:hypothetical protein
MSIQSISTLCRKWYAPYRYSAIKLKHFSSLPLTESGIRRPERGSGSNHQGVFVEANQVRPRLRYIMLLRMLHRLGAHLAHFEMI